MKRTAFVFAAALGLLFAQSARAAITLNFNGANGGSVTFNGTGSGASFDFAPTANNFQIQTTTGGTGSANLLFGTLLGPFAYTSASIVTNGSTQTAPLTGTGSFKITDASAVNFTATVNGVNISTTGTGGTINTNSTVNLSGISYSGTNVDLVALKNAAIANGVILALTFQFVPAKSLSDLAVAGPPNTTSFSGTLTTAAPVPEPATVAMALSGLPILGLLWVRRRKA